MILYNADAVVCDWTSRQLFGITGMFVFPFAKALGVVRNGEIIAGIIYNDCKQRPDGSFHQVEMSVASVDKRWCTRHNLRELFAYPFIQVGLERVQTTCSASNEGVIMFNKRLGFKLEGVHRQAWPMGGDALSWGMLKSDCRWI